MPTVEERLASLEAKVDTMSDLRNLIVELRADMNRRFDDVNRRFDDVNGRFDDVNGRFGDVNGRFGDVNRQFTELREDMNRRFIELRGDMKSLDHKVDRQFIWLVGTQMALLLAVVGALIGAYYR